MPRKKADDRRPTTIDLSDVKPDPKNARKHTPRNLAMLRHSLKEYGAGRSILMDENHQIIAGHGVVEAARDAGIEKIIPVEASGDEIIAVVRRGLTEQQKAELAIADNRTAELSEWDPSNLADAAQACDLEPFFSLEEMASLTHAGKGGRIEELNLEKPVPELVWVLVGVSVNNFGRVRSHLEALENASGIIVKTTRDAK